MDGGPGPSGREQARDLLELVPGKNKTVRLDDPPAISVAGGLIFAVPGTLILWGALRGLHEELLKHDVGGMISAVFAVLFGCLFIFALLLMLYVTFDSSRCVSIGVLCDRLRISEEALRRAAWEQGILARYSIQGRNVYRLDDFEPLNLLRPADPATKADELLHSGSNAQTQTEVLLRGSSLHGTQADDGADNTTAHL